MNMNMNKMNRGKALAAAMAMVMVFACVAVVMSDNGVDAADDTTYLSGQITSSQNFGAGTNVVVNGNLTIPENMTLQIGGKLTVTEGFDLTVNNGGTLIINNGAAAIFDGNLVLKSGAVFQNGAITDTTNKKLGSPLGLYINGGMTVEKGAYIIGAPVATDTPSADASGVSIIPGAGTNDESDVGTISSIKSTTAGGVTTLYPIGNVIEHMNAEGTMGYWIGIRIANAGTAGENSQLKYDGRASVPAVNFGSDKSLDVWINASAKTQTITFVNDDGTQTYVIDCSYVKLGESSITTNPGQIVIGADATFKSNSTKTSPSPIADQTIYLVDGASADVDSILFFFAADVEQKSRTHRRVPEMRAVAEARPPDARHQPVLARIQRHVERFVKPVVREPAVAAPADPLAIQIQIIALIGGHAHPQRFRLFHREALPESPDARRLKIPAGTPNPFGVFPRIG